MYSYTETTPGTLAPQLLLPCVWTRRWGGGALIQYIWQVTLVVIKSESKKHSLKSYVFFSLSSIHFEKFHQKFYQVQAYLWDFTHASCCASKGLPTWKSGKWQCRQRHEKVGAQNEMMCDLSYVLQLHGSRSGHHIRVCYECRLLSWSQDYWFRIFF